MVQIPTYRELPPPIVSGEREMGKVKPDDFDGGQSDALKSLGNNVEGAGLAIGAQQKQNQDYDTQKNFVDFDMAQENALQEAKRNIQGDGTGFADSVKNNYDVAARDFFKTVPEDQKPKYDYLLASRGDTYQKHAFDYQMQTSDQYHVNDVNDQTNTIRSNFVDQLSKGMSDDDAQASSSNAIARGVSLIDHAPLPYKMRAEAKKNFAAGVLEDYWNTRIGAIKAGEDAESLNKDLDRARTMAPSSPNGTAGGVPGATSYTGPSLPAPIDSAITNAAKEAGVDPDTMKVVAQIESSGDPKAVTPSGSYRGLFQLSQAEFRANGGGNILDPTDNARAAANKIAADSIEFKAKYGRDPTASDLYLIHQQGEAGAAAHMDHPEQAAWKSMYSTPEGQQKGAGWAKQAIWGNLPESLKKRVGSISNIDSVTSRDFVNAWDQKVQSLGGSSPMAPGGPSGNLQTADASGAVGGSNLKAAQAANPLITASAGDKPDGLVTPGNIDLTQRPVVKNANGSISTVRSASVDIGDGKTALIPTVSQDGRVLSNDDAIAEYKKTGQHLGVFESEDAADKYAETLHQDQAKLYAPPDRSITMTRYLTPKQIQTLSYKATMAGRSYASKDVDNDVERIRNTGEPVIRPDGRTSLEVAEGLLTKTEYTAKADKWHSAELEHYAVSPLKDMSDEEGQNHINSLIPADDGAADYATRMNVLRQKAQPALNKIQEQRKKDIAKSLEDSGAITDNDGNVVAPGRPDGAREVRDARAYIAANPTMTESQKNQQLFDSRLAAQDRLEIPGTKQRILTRAQGSKMFDIGEDDDAESINNKVLSAADDAYKSFGPKYAERAVKEAISFALAKNDPRRAGAIGDVDDAVDQQKASLMYGGAFGNPPSYSDTKVMRSLIDVDNMGRTLSPYPNPAALDDKRPSISPNFARDFIAGTPAQAEKELTEKPKPGGTPDKPTPYPEEIEELQAHPGYWRIFDRRYGPGSAAAALAGIDVKKDKPGATSNPKDAL